MRPRFKLNYSAVHGNTIRATAAKSGRGLASKRAAHNRERPRVHEVLSLTNSLEDSLVRPHVDGRAGYSWVHRKVPRQGDGRSAVQVDVGRIGRQAR